MGGWVLFAKPIAVAFRMLVDCQNPLQIAIFIVQAPCIIAHTKRVYTLFASQVNKIPFDHTIIQQPQR